jgi:hypothetical protein
LEFDDHDLHWFFAGVDVGVHGVGGHGRKPIGFAGFPDVRLDGAGRIDDVHGTASERDDDSGVVVVVHGERLMGHDDRLPDFDVFVLELRESFGLLNLLFDLRDDGGGAEGGGDEGCHADRVLHEDLLLARSLARYGDALVSPDELEFTIERI